MFVYAVEVVVVAVAVVVCFENFRELNLSLAIKCVVVCGRWR